MAGGNLSGSETDWAHHRTALFLLLVETEQVEEEEKADGGRAFGDVREAAGGSVGCGSTTLH